MSSRNISIHIVAGFWLLWLPTVSMGQLAPEIGYLHPAGIQAGTSIEVTLGGYDWTPDMQLFSHDPRVKLELLSAPSAVLIADAPYWFGAKARGYAWPLPREFRAQLTVAADVAPGLVRWQVANANGVSPVGVIQISKFPDVMEATDHHDPQFLPSLPVTVSGQIRRIEEVDRYQFVAPRSGPITIELIARQLTSTTNPMSLHGMLQVDDDSGRRCLDVAASEGNDLISTFVAEANRRYTIRIHDLDFAGDRSYVYRLQITPNPSLVAAYPSAAKRGETRKVEFVGWGLETGKAQLESISREIQFPTDPLSETFATTVDTAFGATGPYVFTLSDSVELVEGAVITELPVAITGSLEDRFGSDEYSVEFKHGDVLQIAARSRATEKALDLDLAVIGPEGTELATVDDTPGSVDPEMSFTAPVDGRYRIVVTDRSGHSGSRSACYRLSIHKQADDFSLTFPDFLSVPLGTAVKIPVTATRRGSFKGAIELAVDGLPRGISVPSNLTIAEEVRDFHLELTCEANAPASASLAHVAASATLNGAKTTRPVKTLVVAAIMKPRIKITPEGLDDVSKVRRGSTHLFPLLVERLEGFTGDIVLEMTAKQQRHRQGLTSEELVIPSTVKRFDYPIFVPEWMETTKTSRMILNGATQVKDPSGATRILLQKMELRLGILPEGALMKLSHSREEFYATVGGSLSIPFSVSRAADFHEAIDIDLVPEESQSGLISADSLRLLPGQEHGALTIHFASDSRLIGEQPIHLRATALQNNKWMVRSETTANVEIRN